MFDWLLCHPFGVKIPTLPIFYNHSTPSGLKYLALNPNGVTQFFVFFCANGKVANWYFIFIALLIVPNIASNGIKIALCSTINPSGGDKNMLNNAKNILGGVKKILSGVKNTLGGVKNTLGGVKNTLGGVKNTLGGVKNTLGGVKNALGGVKFGVDGIKFKFDVTINCFYRLALS